MKIILLNPAPIGPDLTRWGDYQFGCSLKSALEHEGHSVEQRFWPDWDKGEGGDVSLTLRGKRIKPHKRAALNAVWIMSQPATVSLHELQHYDVIFAGSETLRRRLAGSVDAPVHLLRQCTDGEVFRNHRPVDEDVRKRQGILFVANSRGVRRPVLRALHDAGIAVSIVGRHWDGIGFSDLVTKTYVDNRDLPGLYRDCRLALNDHWCDMKHFGIINNRIFDCLATGTPVFTDRFGELEELCGNAVLYLDDPRNVQAVLKTCQADYAGLLQRIRDLWTNIGHEYSFARRAEQITEILTDTSPVPGNRVRPADADVSHLLDEFDAVRSALATEMIRVLHIGPSAETQNALAARTDLEYVTAGHGIGPWQVDISGGLDTFPESRFHCVVISGRHRPGEADLQPVLVGDGRILYAD